MAKQLNATFVAATNIMKMSGIFWITYSCGECPVHIVDDYGVKRCGISKMRMSDNHGCTPRKDEIDMMLVAT